MLVEPESRHRWPWCRRQYAVDVEGGNDYGMLLAHGHGLWDKGVEVWQVSAGGPLDDIVCVGDELLCVDGIRPSNYAQAGNVLRKPDVRRRCVFLRRRTQAERRCDAWMTRLLVALLSIVAALHLGVPQLVASWPGRVQRWCALRGWISMALPGGPERGWDDHLIIASIGSASRHALQEAQAQTIGCGVHFLRYDESVAPCIDCSVSREARRTAAWNDASDARKAEHRPLGPLGHLRRMIALVFSPLDWVFDLLERSFRRAAALAWSVAQRILALLGLSPGSDGSRGAGRRLRDTFEDAANGLRHTLDFHFEGPSSLRSAWEANPAWWFGMGDEGPAGKRTNATKGWWCAQQRLMAALADVLRSSPRLPEFLLIIDDDTYVNVRALRRYLHRRDPERRLYAGDRNAGLAFVYGGGGHLLSRALLRGLRDGIGDCLARAEDEWCEWHSDWILPACLKTLSLLEPSEITNGHPLLRQDCADELRGGLPRHRLTAAAPPPPPPSPHTHRVCDRTMARYYHDRDRTAGSVNESLRRGTPTALAARACPPKRYRDLTHRDGAHNRSQPVSLLISCHGIKRPSQMREMHRFAC